MAEDPLTPGAATADPFTPSPDEVNPEPVRDTNAGPCVGCGEDIMRPYIAQENEDDPRTGPPVVDRGLHIDEDEQRWHRDCFRAAYPNHRKAKTEKAAKAKAGSA